MASSSSSRQEESTPAPEEATRDWAELPRDALLTVLHKLGHVDILIGAAFVCGPWSRAALEEPELWRRLDLRRYGGFWSRRRIVDLNSMAREAIIRGAGQCEAFLGEGDLDHTVLSLLSDTAALSLKSLRLITCGWINDVPLALTITKFTLLEELELSNCSGDFPETCAAAGQACPLLTRLRLSSRQFIKHSQVPTDREATAIATSMSGLRSLQHFANRISNDGLAAILDGCPLLESLDIRHCFNVEMDDEMIAWCSRIQTLRLPHYSTGDYDLQFFSPDMDDLQGSANRYERRRLAYESAREKPQTEYRIPRRMGVQFTLASIHMVRLP